MRTRTIEVSEETYEKIKEQIGVEDVFDINSYDDMIGKKLFFRTVTYHYTGKITKIVGNFIGLSDAAWIADSGRFMDFLKSGKASEVEPIGEMLLNMNTIVDAIPFNHELPKTQESL